MPTIPATDLYDAEYEAKGDDSPVFKRHLKSFPFNSFAAENNGTILHPFGPQGLQRYRDVIREPHRVAQAYHTLLPLNSALHGKKVQCGICGHSTWSWSAAEYVIHLVSWACQDAFRKAMWNEKVQCCLCAMELGRWNLDNINHHMNSERCQEARERRDLIRGAAILAKCYAEGLEVELRII